MLNEKKRNEMYLNKRNQTKTSTAISIVLNLITKNTFIFFFFRGVRK